MKKTRPFYLTIFLFLFLTSPTVAQLATSSDMEVAGISKERLNRYSAFLTQQIEDGKIPGAVSLISRNGITVQDTVFGYGDLEGKVSMERNNIFHIMSMTKPIVSVALMTLYEQGHFLLQDPVSQYLPQFKDLKVSLDPATGKDGATEPAKSEITIHQVLTHTAGFSHGLGGSQLDKDVLQALYFEPQSSVESRVNTLIAIPLIGQPGEQWYYSASTDVVSLLIEHFSGMTTAEYLEKHIFKPLEMDDTGYNIPKEKQHRWVPVHNLDEEGKLINSKEQLPKDGITVYGGTHGLFSTADDYMKFSLMLLNGGKANGKQILSPKTVELMTVNQVGDLYPGPGEGFGLGFGVTTDLSESRILGSEGTFYWSGAYCTYFFIDPKEELIAVLMTQMQPYTSFYGNKLRQMVYQTLITSQN